MADRPTPTPPEGDTSAEIEVTPEMIAAGIRVLCAYDSEFETREEGAARIFKAMILASKVHDSRVRNRFDVPDK